MLPDGSEAIIQKLSYIKAMVVNSNNEVKNIYLADLKPLVIPRNRSKVVSDGSVPARGISYGSTVRVRKTMAVGKVLNFVYKQAQVVIFIDIINSGNAGVTGI